MDLELIRNWNMCVKDDDIVYALGDMCFHPPRIGVPLLQQLKGHKILIQGNHDKYSATQYRRAGFQTIAQEMLIELMGRRLRLSHYPYWYDGAEAYQARYKERRPIDAGNWLLCGHAHQAWKIKTRQINVGVDVWGLLPVSLSTIEKTIVAQEKLAEKNLLAYFDERPG